MSEVAREAREFREMAAERELTGRNECRVRTVGEANIVQAGLECALTVQVPPLQLRTASVDERTIVSLTEKLTDMRPRSRRVYWVVWAAAANGGLSLRPRNGWEAPQESGKGGREP